MRNFLFILSASLVFVLGHFAFAAEMTPLQASDPNLVVVKQGAAAATGIDGEGFCRNCELKNSYSKGLYRSYSEDPTATPSHLMDNASSGGKN